jgi:hypothetical protein
MVGFAAYGLETCLDIAQALAVSWAKAMARY